MSGRLAGKIAIVNGAGSVGPGWGNGRATTVLFAREGAKVIAVDRNKAAMDETFEKLREASVADNVTPYACDVMDNDAVAELAASVRRDFGRIDVLVNNVGGPASGGAAELSEKAWDQQIDFNLKTVYLSCHHVIPIMVEQGGGSIVNTASTSGIRWSGTGQVGYAASKAGVIQFSRVTAVQYGPRGVRVNTVIPGLLHTPMVEARMTREQTDADVKALLDQRQKRIPLGFAGDGRDVAACALFLASDEARFVSGTEIVVDGAMSARCD